jgi:ATP-dependent Clp protease protease subunit
MKLKVTIGLILATLLVVVSSGSTAAQGTKAPDSSNLVVLSSSNTLVLNSEVDGDSVGKVIAEAKKLDTKLSGFREKASGKAPLYLILNTPGGSIQSGLELIEAMNGLGRKVNTVTMFAASMGFQIAQNLDDRLILKSGVLMSHHAAGGFQGQFGGASPSQVDSRYQLWLDRIKELDEQTVKRTNGKQTYESYIKQYDHEMWLTGTKSVEQGYADKVVTVKCDSSLSGTTPHQIDYMGIPVTYDLDNCPLNTSPLNVKVGATTVPLSQEYVKKIVNEFLTGFISKSQQPIQMTF